MDNKWEIIKNGGADIAPQDAGEWRDQKREDVEEDVRQEALERVDELEIYEQLSQGVY